MEDSKVRKHTASTSVILHLAPGAAVAAFVFGMSAAFSGAGVPSYFFLELGMLAIGLPIMLALMRRGARLEGGARIAEAVAYRAKLRWWEYIVWPFLMLAIAGVVMGTLGKTVTPFFRDSLFGWLPPAWDIADLFVHPAAYSKAWLVATWALGIPTTTLLGPYVEELYFRGYLLPRIRGRGAAAVLAGALLFASYHLFTPWMIPIRVIALVPFVWFVWWKKDVRLGIVAHCALNLFGDTLSAIPLVFG